MDDKIGLFEYTTNFCTDKKDLRKHPDFLKSYNPFMVNKVLSMSPKTCYLALFMSQNWQIPREQHFAFLNEMVDKDRIYFNYAKISDDVTAETLRYIREYYVCSMSRALEYVRIMSGKQVKTIFDIMKQRDAKPKKTKGKNSK
jgi:hypothetical protein